MSNCAIIWVFAISCLTFCKNSSPSFLSRSWPPVTGVPYSLGISRQKISSSLSHQFVYSKRDFAKFCQLQIQNENSMTDEKKRKNFRFEISRSVSSYINSQFALPPPLDLLRMVDSSVPWSQEESRIFLIWAIYQSVFHDQQRINLKHI